MLLPTRAYPQLQRICVLSKTKRLPVMPQQAALKDLGSAREDNLKLISLGVLKFTTRSTRLQLYS